MTSENVLVCARTYAYICVMDLNFENFYKLNLENFNPIRIAKFNNHFMVTGEAAIAVIDIDFKEKKLKSVKILQSMNKGKVSEHFKSNVAFIGICCSDRYIYVTQKEKEGPGYPILCLQYDEENELNYVCEISDFPTNCDDGCKKERCGPVTLFNHKNGEILYSQGSYKEQFHIVKASHNPRETIKSNKLFNVD